MAYYVRVLSTSADCVPLTQLRASLVTNGFDAMLSGESDESGDWTEVVLSHANGREIAAIERNPVEQDSLGAEELSEFVEEVADCKPAEAAQWLLEYFKSVRCIYAFQVLSGTDHQNGWDILDAVKSCVWTFAPSILQADLEGFSNEEGFHILWQFAEGVDGPYSMAVLRDGQWVTFQMQLSNYNHREAFFRGEVPAGVAGNEPVQ